MKRIAAVFVLASLLVACNDNTEVKMENELDSLGQNIKEGWDSTKAEAKELKDTLENKWDNRKDSADRDSANRK